jgi:hypothetical protein
MRTDAIDRILDRLEPETPPSRRYHRLVYVGSGSATVLEMRDPNSGQGGGPESRPRHQYLRAGGVVWTRTLPPEEVGDAWADTGAPRWEPMQHVAGLVAEMAPHLPAAPVAVLRRLPMQVDGEDVYDVRGETRSADDVADVEVIAGPITDAWYDVPLPRCPDCGGDVAWYEAGYVPGARKCLGARIATEEGEPVYDTAGGCGSLYTVETIAVATRRDREPRCLRCDGPLSDARADFCSARCRAEYDDEEVSDGW